MSRVYPIGVPRQGTTPSPGDIEQWDGVFVRHDELPELTGGEVSDAALAAIVSDPDSQTVASLSGTFATPAVAAAKADEVIHDSGLHTAPRGYLPRIVSLIAGQPDETLNGQSGGAVSADTTNTRVGGRAWKITAAAAGGPGAHINFPGGLPVPPAQAVVAWFYVPDATKVSDLGLHIYGDAELSTPNRWTQFLSTLSPRPPVVTGWNRLRLPITNQPAHVTTIHRVTVAYTATAATEVTVGHVYLECPEKARILFVNDGAYKSFLANAYPDMKARGWPVTFAPAVSLLPSDAGMWSEKPTVEELAAYGRENRNSLSFHSWASEVTSTMTADQYRAETAKAVKWMQRQGWRGRMWRAAITQNAAPNWLASRDMLIGSMSGNNTSRPNIWPPNDLMHIFRVSLDNSASAPAGTARVDEWFATMKRTHMTYVPYVHGVGLFNGLTGNEFNATQELWDYFIAKADAAVAEGWLEFVTFEQLFYGSGGSFTDMGGEAVARYLDATGAEVIKRVL